MPDDVIGQGRASEGGAGVQAQPAKLSLFLRSAIPDFILVLVASVALVYTVSYAFESAPQMRSDVLLCAGLCAPMIVALFLGSWSKRAVVVSAALAIAYAIGVLAFMASQLPAGVELLSDGQINDVAENPVVFGLVALIVPVAVYLLSRRKIGAVALFAASAFTCGVVQFLYRDWSTSEPGTLAAFVAILACGMLFVFQSYRSSVYHARRVTQTSFGAAMAFSLLLVGLCVLGASAVYYSVIDPLGIQTPEVKPFEDYFQKPEVEYRSVYEEQEIENPDVLTNATNNETDQTNKDAEGGVEGQTAENQEDWSGSPLSALIRNALSFDSENWNETFQAISYQQIAIGSLIALALIVCALVVAVLARRSMRKRRLRKLNDKSRAYGVWYLYNFISERLERLGFVKPDTFTALEFALASRNAMAQFSQGTGGVDYLQLTLVYQRACYAPETLTEQDQLDVMRYYDEFFRNARKFVGTRRWLWKFWRI